MSVVDSAYDATLEFVLEEGEVVPTRARLLSTGETIKARSLISYSMEFCVWEEFPLLTTKFVSFSNVLRELLWFISGSTNERDLSRHGVHIWKQWASPTGELGPVYGAAWRRYEGKDKTVDQLASVVEGIRAVVKDPEASVGRRLIVNAWDPTRLDEMALPPCHMFFQFFVRGSVLHMQVYQRSADLFLGVPYNIASYATLLMMVAQITGLKPGRLAFTFGDLHLYENHIEQAKEQMSREPRDAPKLVIVDRGQRSLDDFVFEDFRLEGYDPHPALRGEVAV